MFSRSERERNVFKIFPVQVQKPSEFDEHLPGVKAADLSHLQEQVPELAQYLQ